MTSQELANAIVHMLQSIESRIVGVGAQQYDKGNKQKIEEKSVEKVLDESLEEIDDLLVYLSWARIRVQRVRANLKDLT
jgi:hypothetical protein